MPDPQQQTVAAAPPPDIFDTLAQQDTQRMQHDQVAAQTGDVFDQIAANNGQPLSEPTAPTPTQPPSMFPGSAPGGNMYPGAPLSASAPPVDLTQPGVMNTIGRGLESFAANDIPNPFAAIKHVVTNPSLKDVPGPISMAATSLKESVAGYEAYEQARSSGKSVMDSLLSASEQIKKQDDAAQMVQQRIDEFKKDPGAASVRSLADVTALAASIYMGAGKGPSAGVAGQAAPELAGEEAATASTPASESAATPKAQAVAQGTAKAAKAGISEGTAETVAPTGEEIQPQLHAGIRQFINQTASDAGLDAIPDSTPITDAPQELADSFQARSQATFDQIEKITGIDPTALKEQMAARADQITEATAGGDLEKAGKLDMLQKADENRSIQAFNQAKAQGVDVEQARSDWNASLRGDELSAAVRNSKASTSTLKNPVLDPAKLAPRLQKLAESQPGGKTPKLFQLGGEDNATALVEHAENARDATQAIKDFVPQSATGQKLFSQIVSNNTAEKSSLLRGGNSVGVTDWNGVLKDIGNLTPAQQSALGNDLARMRQVAGRQALKQNALKALSFGTKLGVGAETLHHAVNAVSGH
jgi:hypothetical protein